MFSLFSQYLQLDNQEYGSLPRDFFEASTSDWKRILTPSVYDKLLNLSTRKGLIKKKILAIILDAYKYMPVVVQKNKNDSNQFRSQAMFREEPQNHTQTEKNYHYLGTRVEEKFKEITKAYRFFDNDKVSKYFDGSLTPSYIKNGIVMYPEFKQGLDNLCIRLTDQDARELFNFMDKV